MPETHVLSIEPAEYSYLFSICTIVNSHDEYANMKDSFITCGFTDACEYLIADNTAGNTFDAYQAIAAFIRQSKGKYIMIVHQDVLCIDRKEQLINCIDQLSSQDNKWGICGNAGGVAYHEDVMYINNAGKIKISANLPARVMSLDENFLVIRHDSNVTISADLSGFHLYGTDLCLIADMLGYHAYVIPFMVKHLSYGNLGDLDSYIPVFVEKYGEKFRGRYMETTCTRFYLSNSRSKNRFFNSSFVWSLIKLSQRIKKMVRFSRFGNQHKKTVTAEDAATRSNKTA